MCEYDLCSGCYGKEKEKADAAALHHLFNDTYVEYEVRDSAPENAGPTEGKESDEGGLHLAKENEKWHKELKTDIAMLLKDGKEQTDLVEAFCTARLCKKTENLEW